jgi:hypothetical protein
MKFLSLFALSLAAFGQSATMAPVATPVPPAAPVATPASAGPALPTTLAGAGFSWQRGAAYPLQENTIYAKDFTTTANNQKIATPWFLWVIASTPITPTPTGSQPTPSTISAGASYVAAQSASGSVLLVLTATGGLSATQASAGGTFNGNVGVAFRLGRTHWYAMPYVGGSSLVGGVSSGSFVAQPGVAFLYGWGN